MVNEKAKTINLNAKSDKEFFLIHGYTGSPTDFNDLPNYLNKRFKSKVYVPRLIGHGETIGALDNLEYSHFLEQLRKELKKEVDSGKKIILVGISFGALLALDLAKEFPIAGIISISLPYELKFPFNIPGIKILGKFKKYWKKKIFEEEKLLRKGFNYTHMHKNALSLVNSSKKNIDLNLDKIITPFLGIQVKQDSLGSVNGLKKVYKKINSPIKEISILDSKVHNIFYSNYHKNIYKLISEFVEKNKLFEKGIKQRKKVAAIVPAYNEAERISEVLNVLVKSPILDEIIVVDDGSSDNTEEKVRMFKKVKFLKNKTNMGKSFSMDRGVKSTQAEIIFFCDADLKGFKPQDIEEIITPVKEGKVDMFIGARGNFMQKAVKKWAINSGERALKREIWEKLPVYYKHRYRVEAGLNNFVKFFGNGFDYKIFNYSQTLKESKYGFFKGTFLRWWMNLDVFMAVLRFHFWDRFRNLN